MQVNIKDLFTQLDKIDELLQTAELEPAVAEAVNLHHLLAALFKEYQPGTLDLAELHSFSRQLNLRIDLLKKRQLEIQKQVADISEVGSNKVSKTYLAK